MNIDAKYCHIFLSRKSISSFLILSEMSLPPSPSLFLSVPFYIKSAAIVLYLPDSVVHVIKIQHRVEAGRRYPRTSLKRSGSRRICRERDVASAPILEFLLKINTFPSFPLTFSSCFIPMMTATATTVENGTRNSQTTLLKKLRNLVGTLHFFSSQFSRVLFSRFIPLAVLI